MIPRYTRPEAAAIWAAQSRFRIMFEIAAHAADKLAELGVIPKAAAAVIWDRGRDAVFDLDRIDEIARETGGEVAAFLTHLSEIVGPEARVLTPTVSGLADTALAVQLCRATDLLIEDVDLLLEALKTQAFAHRLTPMAGAPPTTVGLRLAGHYAAFQRAKERLAMARFEIATCALAGPAGTFADLDPAVEAHVAQQLGLWVEPISIQGIPRDRHAAYVAALAVVGGSEERLVSEIGDLQGAPPLENLAGLSRLVRAAVVPALETAALRGGRDAATEQAVVAEITVHLDFALHRLAGAVDAENSDNVLNNINTSDDRAPLNLGHDFKTVDTIFARVFGEQAMAKAAT